MKRMLVLFGLLLLLVPTGSAVAGDSTFGLGWSVSLPTGDTSDYISKVSFRGATLEWRNFYQRDAAYGLNVGWNVFNKTETATYNFETGAVTGTHWRYINAVPMYASWFKYLNTDRRSSRFFVGGNIGTAWIERRTEIGLLRIDDTNWHFAIAPEVGWNLPWDSFLGYVGLRYNYAFKAGESEAQQWLELKIGFGLD